MAPIQHCLEAFVHIKLYGTVSADQICVQLELFAHRCALYFPAETKSLLDFKLITSILQLVLYPLKLNLSRSHYLNKHSINIGVI